jgi:DNA-binding PadR family transcriptional regulator
VKQLRATAELLWGFHKIRILHLAAAGHGSPPELLESLRRHDRHLNLPALNRVLLRMVRNGWLASRKRPVDSSPDYAITSKGRVVLKTARTHLNVLVALPQHRNRQ